MINAQRARSVHGPAPAQASLLELVVLAHHSWQLRALTEASRTVLISSADIPRSSMACFSDISHCFTRSLYQKLARMPAPPIRQPETIATSGIRISSWNNLSMTDSSRIDVASGPCFRALPAAYSISDLRGIKK